MDGKGFTLTLPVAVQVDAPVQDLQGETDAHFEKLRGDLRFPAQKGAFFSVSVSLVVLVFGYWLWIVTQLRSVFRSLRGQKPFIAENARRIRWVGLSIIFGEIARTVIVYVWSYYTSLHFTGDGLRFSASADFHLITVVGGLAMVAVAEAFQQGARLQEEQSLTI